MTPSAIQPGNEHGGSRTQIVGAHAGSRELFNPLYNRHLAVDLNVGAHFGELVHIFKTIVPNTLADNACPLCNRKKGGKLGLHIGGKTGVRQRLYDALGQRTVGIDAHPIIALDDLCTGLDEL